MLKVEIDVLKDANVNEAAKFAAANRCPTIISSPELFTKCIIARSMVRGNYKILTAIDWPKGTKFLSNKFRGVPSESLNSDGFEILLTNEKKVGINKEIKFLIEFIQEHFPPTIELRFVLGYYLSNRNSDSILYMLEAMKSMPGPNMVRTTHLTKIPASYDSIESHNSIINSISNIRQIPIKISGNISHTILKGCKSATRFGCTLEQAKALQKELSNKSIDKITREVVNS